MVSVGLIFRPIEDDDDDEDEDEDEEVIVEDVAVIDRLLFCIVPRGCIVD